MMKIWLAWKTVTEGKMNLNLIPADPLAPSSSPHSTSTLLWRLTLLEPRKPNLKLRQYYRHLLYRTNNHWLQESGQEMWLLGESRGIRDIVRRSQVPDSDIAKEGGTWEVTQVHLAGQKAEENAVYFQEQFLYSEFKYMHVTIHITTGTVSTQNAY